MSTPVAATKRGRHVSTEPPTYAQQCQRNPDGRIAKSFAAMARHRKPGPPSTPADVVVAAADLPVGA